MQEKVNFALIFHFHQPIGNFDYIIENAYQKSYLPLIQMIRKFPKIKIGLHFTGYLLEWLEKNHLEYFDILKDMSNQRQIEMIGGAYYEPIIAVIPDRDKKAQIDLLRYYIKGHFNLDIKGFWLAERAWEPHLPKILNECGIEYILIDDFHLRANGLYEEETFFPYYTEEQGKVIKVIPINEPLRYMIPWKQPWEPVDYLKKYKTEDGDRLITLISDAEKMGVWPAGDMTTYDICYVKGYDGTPWLESWFRMLSDSTTDWLNMLHISEYLQNYKPKGLIYMPTASYDKMSYWVLPTRARRSLEELIKKAQWNQFGEPYSKEILQFLKGGFWRGFFVKYPESNLMHKKMLHVRGKVERYEEIFREPDLNKLKAIWIEIYKSQVNDPYWHGQFGGVYFSFMRETVYSCLINAEAKLESFMKEQGLEIKKIYERDLTFDGRPEIIMENEHHHIYIQPHYGASILEIDIKEALHNILNVFTRKEEAYHKPDSNFPYDRWRKQGFIDHFIQESFNMNQLEIPLNDLDENSIEAKVVLDKFEDIGDFAVSNYYYETDPEGDVLTCEMSKTGKIKGNDVEVKKDIILHKKTIEVKYKIKNLSDNKLETYHYVELPVYIDSDMSKNNILANKNIINVKDISNWKGSQFSIKNSDKKIYLKLSTTKFCNLLVYPLMTYVSTDGGYDSLFQGAVCGMQTKISLNKDEIHEMNYILKFEED
ncbi:MAG: alpha-amylase/4-alpha-glucanotransferase domain-containing protein [Candidatus Helarchaeota archaeon]